MTKVLLAGATGTLGSYLAKELLAKNFATTLIARNTNKLNNINAEIVKAELTKP